MYRDTYRNLLSVMALVLSFGVVMTACSDDSTGNQEPIPDVVSFIKVTPSNSTLQVGGTVQLSAEAFNQFGSPMAGVAFSWLSLNGDIATVDNAGLVTAEGEGSTGVFAVAPNLERGGSAVEVVITP